MDGEGRRPAVDRAARVQVARELAALHGGVFHRRELRARGIDRHDVRTEVRAGRWFVHGRHTLTVGPSVPDGVGRWWWAVWESGSGAVLTGESALVAGGLKGYTEAAIRVAVPRSTRAHRLEGVALSRPRVMDPTIGAGIPRVRPDWATIRAAQAARSDRQAALLVCMAVQQRLTTPTRLLAAWDGVGRSRRRGLLDAVVRDVCDGAHSLGELDFARLCRAGGLPEPCRQVVVDEGPRGRVYLDVEFPGGRAVEIDGAQHQSGLAVVDDALRANELVLGGRQVLRIPVLGLRLEPSAFMEQVARYLDAPVMQGASDLPRSA
jgi:hypothetical protein